MRLDTRKAPVRNTGRHREQVLLNQEEALAYNILPSISYYSLLVFLCFSILIFYLYFLCILNFKIFLKFPQMCNCLYFKYPNCGSQLISCQKILYVCLSSDSSNTCTSLLLILLPLILYSVTQSTLLLKHTALPNEDSPHAAVSNPYPRSAPPRAQELLELTLDCHPYCS